jgi:hypothetical protein
VAGRATGEAHAVGQDSIVIAIAEKREMGAYLPNYRAGIPAAYGRIVYGSRLQAALKVR